MEDKFYTINEVAKQLKVVYLTVYRWIHANKIRAYKIGKQYRIKEVDLKNFIEEKVV